MKEPFQQGLDHYDELTHLSGDCCRHPYICDSANESFFFTVWTTTEKNSKVDKTCVCVLLSVHECMWCEDVALKSKSSMYCYDSYLFTLTNSLRMGIDFAAWISVYRTVTQTQLRAKTLRILSQGLCSSGLWLDAALCPTDPRAVWFLHRSLERPLVSADKRTK